MKTTLLTVEQDQDGELYIILSDEMLEQLGWEMGDEINWSIGPNNQIMARKVKNNENS
jgi:antitoxin component of MazEF toxin-antitoxin module